MAVRQEDEEQEGGIVIEIKTHEAMIYAQLKRWFDEGRIEELWWRLA